MTTFEVRGNPNYSAWIAEVLPGTLRDLENCDNVRGFYASGYQCIVGKDVKVGDILVVFPAEVQISHEFLSLNNLYRHSDLNIDESKRGYIEDNRRVKALKFRGHHSNALALPLSSLPIDFLGNYPEVGTQFDTINGIEISRKYEIPVKANSMAGRTPAEKAWKRVDDKALPEHIDTENWFRNEFKVPEDAWITVTQKIHGTSWRGANTIVKRRLTWFERVLKRLGVSVAETEYDYVFGSRKVIKDPHNPNQDHFYGYDLWSEFGKSIEHLIPKNVVVYGELVGWTPEGTPIQAGYTYRVPKGEQRLYVYRVAVVTEDGGLYDLSRSGVEEFCAQRGLLVVPLLWQGFKRDFDADAWLDTTYYPVYSQAVPLGDDSPVDEGVVIQAEGVVPANYKAKSPIFLGHETALLDKEVEILS